MRLILDFPSNTNELYHALKPKSTIQATYLLGTAATARYSTNYSLAAAASYVAYQLISFASTPSNRFIPGEPTLASRLIDRLSPEITPSDAWKIIYINYRVGNGLINLSRRWSQQGQNLR